VGYEVEGLCGDELETCHWKLRLGRGVRGRIESERSRGGGVVREREEGGRRNEEEETN
jgi:hypothetical protein